MYEIVVLFIGLMGIIVLCTSGACIHVHNQLPRKVTETATILYVIYDKLQLASLPVEILCGYIP
jgi:hypothetical protein